MRTRSAGKRITATFAYAGIDVAATPLFSGVRGAQLAGPLPARHGRTRPFTDTITDLITGMENALDLHAHRPGTFRAHAPYLHQRTVGRIGSLARLNRQAAVRSDPNHLARGGSTTGSGVRGTGGAAHVAAWAVRFFSAR
ncbi:hypothetical protein [Streptomyces poonensis]|uniref:Uncharacterized protein n=1 Tax=Streptomyces poonensis TaxID=68255 RepID=A0A918Q2T2_9ACTN|nr:hypothetical protein [Streptomyces poonensis]GGZ30430.1 hypothetical protein GCM10010365_58710 [Streptomyces poonensis]